MGKEPNQNLYNRFYINFVLLVRFRIQDYYHLSQTFEFSLLGGVSTKRELCFSYDNYMHFIIDHTSAHAAG